ncbi:MAG: double-strand break repair helicase AddA [Alphaproteobacteria bacterium]|nr:double-strand break repair helicase AddA [Alphaproteobacteria bacterium]
MQALHKQEKYNSPMDPARSVFVAANAGSGKTSLLAGRVLALLMHGVAPSKILCLTFTNGAAAEMTERITSTLGSWVMMEEEELKQKLLALIPGPVSTQMVARARSLFAQVLDHPVGLRLQTIHGFCQSLLARFPLEAGVGMHLSVMDDATRHALLKEARMQLFAGAKGSDYGDALHDLVQQLGEYSLLDLLAEMVAQKRKLSRFIDAHHGTALAIKAIYKTLGVGEDESFAALAEKHVRRGDAHIAALRKIAETLAAAGGKTNTATAGALSGWAAGGDEAAWESYAAWMLVDHRPRKQLFTKNTLSSAEEELLSEEQACAERMAAALNALADARLTDRLLTIGATLIAHYDALKERHSLMDFDDQILAALRLLSQSDVGAWVMYKLDGGIDHVLVDEAQDTSPEQWDIVRAITGEFFAGIGRSEADRSLFVVGDEKQSIFRFQGADPAGLATNRDYFMRKLQDAHMAGEVVALTHSYRSAPEILQLVDAVFANEVARKGLSARDATVSHQAKRSEAKGYCELWPLALADEERHLSAENVLARQIAVQVEEWMKQGVSPGDIMVLVRRRTRFVPQLSRALKRRNIPVAGVDRMNLLDNIAVQDLLAFAQILLFPEDDLTLAGLLKSPLFNIGEDELFTLCHDRKTSLWQAISGSPAHALLAEFRAKVDFIPPYALFAELLDARGFRRAFAGRMGEETHEVLDVFLEQTLLYEQSGAPSMQGFLAWVQAGESEIKRDMEHASGRLRIITVHAAKGLQAKIVIVADSTSLPNTSERLQWQEGVPLATIAADQASAAVQEAKAREKELQVEESHRLLYVALTRAEDVLVVCGAFNGKNKKTGVQDGSWYQLAERAFTALGTKSSNERLAFGQFPAIAKTEETPAATPLPLVLLGHTVPEEAPQKPISPSHLTLVSPAASSPLADPRLVTRGIAIHRMLQYLPSVEAEKRREVAITIAQNHAPELDAEALADEVLRVMDTTEFAPLFGPGSMAEVPISGVVEWQGAPVAVLGQVDRLVVMEKEVWVVDYKSSAAPPAAPPLAYAQQMALYAAVLAKIYPSRRIRTALLWTTKARLDLLDETLPSAYI